MNIVEYNKVSKYKYDEYVRYLMDKYGIVDGDYFTEDFSYNQSIKRRDEELFIHHIREDKIAGLSNVDVAKSAPAEYQHTENLVYANLLEHILLHILIGEQNNGLGFGGTEILFNQANDFYDNFDDKRESVLADGFEVLELLKERCRNSIAAYDVLLQHNATVFYELDNTLIKSDRALVVIGTGLGKTTTALAYIRKYNMRAIVLGPNRVITDAWAKNNDIDTYTYQWFMNNYTKIDYSNYGVLICDEAHHCAAPEWGKGIRYVLEKGLIKVIGLTATPKENKEKKNYETSSEFFKGCVCQGFTVLDSIERGIIHDFSYVGAIYDTSDIKEKYSNCKDTALLGELDLALNNTPTVKDIFLRHMPKNKRKGIIFVSNINAMDEAERIMRDIYPNTEYRRMHSLMLYNEVEETREWFQNTDEGYLLAVNMISEGAHYKGVNTIIMFRRTKSSLVFNQQLGRIITLAKDEDPHTIVFDLVNNAENLDTEKSFAGSLRKSYRVRKERGGRKKSKQIIVEDYAEVISEVLRKIADTRIGYRAVYQIDPATLEIIAEFSQITLAAKAIDGTVNAIYAACNCSGTSAGYYWCYKEEYENWVPKKDLRYHGLWCVELEQFFQTAQEAYEKTGADRSGIVASCKNWNCTSGSYHWCYIEDKNIWEPTKTQYHNQRAVWCVETKTKYDTCAEAAKVINSRSSDISAVCCGRRKTAGGYHWEYVKQEE